MSICLYQNICLQQNSSFPKEFCTSVIFYFCFLAWAEDKHIYSIAEILFSGALPSSVPRGKSPPFITHLTFRHSVLLFSYLALKGALHVMMCYHRLGGGHRPMGNSKSWKFDGCPMDSHYISLVLGCSEQFSKLL